LCNVRHSQHEFPAKTYICLTGPRAYLLCLTPTTRQKNEVIKGWNSLNPLNKLWVCVTDCYDTRSVLTAISVNLQFRLLLKFVKIYKRYWQKIIDAVEYRWVLLHGFSWKSLVVNAILCSYPIPNFSTYVIKSYVWFSWNLILENFSKICRENSSFHDNPTRITGTLNEDLCTFKTISHWIFLRMINISVKNCREN
jgi:hypothetical protein